MGLSEPELRQRTLDGLMNGTLPRTLPAQRWAGHGSGAECDACGTRIAASDVEVEIEGAEARRPFHLRLHLHCAAVLEELAQRFESE